jgi:hypothetical protein
LPLQVVFLVFTALTALFLGVALGTRAVALETDVPLHTFIILGMAIEHWKNVAFYCYVVVVYAGCAITLVSWWETFVEWAEGVIARDEQARALRRE